MMESRTTNASSRRAEQLKRWNESDTNRESCERSSQRKSSKIKFTDGCVFLAACAAGEKNEVKKMLQDAKTDIDTANIDGLTALHQACIDDNLEMVEFLVEHGSDINRGDNEGWTPLHATASCGFISIAKYLMDAGANVASVNNDGDLPIDIAEYDEMEELLQSEINKQGIDTENARNAEEKMMIDDAEKFLKDSSFPLVVHDKTGATPLHVAAAKGYIKVISLLIECGVSLDAQDFDGWTALHAAAHWCQKEACELLIESLCDMEVKNFAGQTAFDVADEDLISWLDEMKTKQATLKKNKKDIEPLTKKAEPPPLKRRTSVTRMSVADKSNVNVKDASSERAALLNHPENLDDMQTRHRIDETIEEDNGEENNHIESNNIEQNDILNEIIQLSQEQDAKQAEEAKVVPEKPVVDKVVSPPTTPIEDGEKPPPKVAIWPKGPIIVAEENADNKENKQVDDNVPIWRRVRSRNTANINNKSEEDTSLPSDVNTSQASVHTRTTTKLSPSSSSSLSLLNSSTTTNRNSASWTLPTITNLSVVRSATYPCLNDRSRTYDSQSNAVTSPTTTVTVSLPCSTNVRRSTVPPVRDEESETQRRAHAKRVRETRRSTQGVTLEDLKSAEQQYLRKQQEEDEKKEREREMNKEHNNDTTATTTAPEDSEKRISWRQRYQQLQEDAKEPVYRRSRNQSSENITLPLRTSTQNRSDDDNPSKDGDEQDKTAQGTQAVIIRRRRPKRRSTGVVMLDLEDEAKSTNQTDSKPDPVTQPSQQKSRLSESNQSLASDGSQSVISVESNDSSVDYKRLYEDLKEENDRLKDKLSKTETALKDATEQLDKVLQNNRNSMSDTEKRERRALERKLSEMEEEIKVMDQLKAENAKYKDENGALIRVISKLSK